MMTHDEAAQELQCTLEALGYVEVWKRQSYEDMVTLFCRIRESQLQAWKDEGGVIQMVLDRASAVNDRAGSERVVVFIAQRYLDRPRFGYTWQVSLWAEDWAEGVALFAGLGPAPSKRGQRPAPLPQELDEVPLRARATASTSKDDRGFPVRKGAMPT